jgi:hypothetical protein
MMPTAPDMPRAPSPADAGDLQPGPPEDRREGPIGREEMRARARRAREEPAWTVARRMEARRLKQQGRTLREIGEILGVGKERARQLVFRAARAERTASDAAGR